MEPAYDRFTPNGIPCGEQITLAVDEYEVIRLIDLEKKTHSQCAELMNVSRTTITEIYETARHKIADSIVNGKSLVISGGNYHVCDGSSECCYRKHCRKIRSECEILQRKGADEMRIAVTYENGEIFQHFGHTEQFKIYDVQDGKIIEEKVISNDGPGHGALAGFLRDNQVDVLICGGIGGGAQNALSSAGIKLYGGVSGDADEAVKALLSGNLGYDPDVHCNHHESDEGAHSCGSHTCR